MDNIDWYNHYINKKEFKYSKDEFEKNLKLDQPYLSLLKKYLRPKSKILECGCGLARTAISMANEGFSVVCLENQEKMLNLAKENSRIAGVRMNFILMDFFDIDKKFKESSFDCITHQGVLEHYTKIEIKEILKKELMISPLIIFSVPIKTDFNSGYFKDNNYRNLWSGKIWLTEILKGFNVVESKEVKQRSDNLLIVIKRD